MLLLLLPKPKFNLKLRNPGSPGMQAETQIHTHRERERDRELWVIQESRNSRLGFSHNPRDTYNQSRKFAYFWTLFDKRRRNGANYAHSAAQKDTGKQGQWDTGTVVQWGSRVAAKWPLVYRSGFITVSGQGRQLNGPLVVANSTM